MFSRFDRSAALAATTAILLLASSTALWEAHADSKQKPAVEPSPLLEPAKQAYATTGAAFDVGTVKNVEELYRWSRRWMEAEIASAKTPQESQQANKAHLRRMQQLHLKIDALFQAGVLGGEAERYYATQYYLAEAKLLAAE